MRAPTCQKRRGGVTLLAASATRTAKEGEDLGGRRLRCHGLLFPLHLIISHEGTEESESGKVQRARPRRQEIHRFVLPPSLRPFVRPSFSPSSRLFSFCSPSRSLFRSIDRRMPSFSCFLSPRQLFTRTNHPKIYATRFKIGGQ